MSEPSPEVWLETAQIASERKRHAEAHRAAESALDLRPGWLEALNIALHASAKLGRRAAFRKHAAAVLAIPHAERPRLSDKKLGRYALLAGAYDLASEIGERLLDRDPHSAAGIFLVASAAWEVGDTARAEALLAGALASGDEGAFRGVFDYRLRLDDPGGEEADRLGAAGRAWVLAERSWTAHGRAYLELYEQLGVLETDSVSSSGA